MLALVLKGKQGLASDPLGWVSSSSCILRYVLFSIGNLTPLFQAAFRSCWHKPSKICNDNWISAVDYLEIIGIICGQVLVGILGDWYVSLLHELFTFFDRIAGWVGAGVSFKMQPSCSWVYSCLLRRGESLKTDGSSVMLGLSSFMASVLAENIQ